MNETKRSEIEKALSVFEETYQRDEKKAIHNFLMSGGYVAEQEERRLIVSANKNGVAYNMGKSPAFLAAAEEAMENLEELRELIITGISSTVPGAEDALRDKTVSEALEWLLRLECSFNRK